MPRWAWNKAPAKTKREFFELIRHGASGQAASLAVGVSPSCGYATTLPSDFESYFTQVSPSFLNTPADGPYNMTYVLGSWTQVSWDEHVRVDTLSEMHNRRVVGSDTGSTYGDSQPGA